MSDNTMYFDCLTSEEARHVCMRNGVSQYLFRQAFQKLNDPNFRMAHGPHVYLIDGLTDTGCRVTYSYPFEDGWEVKISSRTGVELLNALEEAGGYAIDHVVFID